MANKRFSFEEIFEQNERRIHYHLHKLNIHDPHKEYYQEGLIAMWTAHKNYQPDRGPLSSYFNFIIHRRLIDLIRKESLRSQREVLAASEDEAGFETEVYKNAKDQLTVAEDFNTHDDYLWKQIKKVLTEKQWKWVQHYVIEDKSIKEIAEQEGVSIEAVKGWAKEARRKLRKVDLGKI